MSDIHDQITNALPAISHLECRHCGHRREAGDVATHLRGKAGWPTCCHGHTMHLITQKQVTTPAPSEH